jgi:hypothetical protein
MCLNGIKVEHFVNADRLRNILSVRCRNLFDSTHIILKNNHGCPDAKFQIFTSLQEEVVLQKYFLDCFLDTLHTVCKIYSVCIRIIEGVNNNDNGNDTRSTCSEICNLPDGVWPAG